MNRNPTRRAALVALVLAVALVGPASNQVWGYWGGFGIGGFNYVPSPGDFLNAHALSNAARAGRPPSNNVYAGNPNSYLNRIRDNGFVPSYDITRRVPPAQRAPRVSPGERAAAAQPAAIARPVVPLPTFFDSTRRLVWPSDAPVGGELQQKRDVSDESSRVVLGELEAQGRATVGSVTDSRLKLIAYGQPALQEIRTAGTARVADAFHLFMLSLYESLGQAASPPEATAASGR
jgi:hypothetical protein